MLIIDDVELDLVRSNMTREWFVSFLDECLHQIAKHIEDLDRPTPDPDRLADMAHSMIGSAAVIGAARVEAIARRLEAVSRANEVGQVGELTAQLIAAWTEVAHAVKLRRDHEPVS